MKFVNLLPLLGLALALPMPLAAQSSRTEANKIAAVVNGEVILQSEVRSAAQMQLQMIYMQNPHMSKAEFEKKAQEIASSALQDLIDRELILASFKEMKATIRDQHIDEAVNRFIRERFEGDRAKFLSELDKNGLTLKQFRTHQEETIIVQAMRARNAGSNDDIVTPFEEKEFWEKNPQLFSSEGFVKLRTITIPKVADGEASTAASQKALVDNVLEKLRGGADFGSMASTYSVDSGKLKEGERGTFARADLNGQLAEVAFSIKPQTVSDAIDLGDFYTIVYVDARENGKVSPLSEVREEVRRRVLMNKKQEKVEVWLTRLRRDANIKIFE